MIISKKSQNSMEFVVLTSFMMFVFLVFFIIIQQRIATATEQKNDATAGQILDIAVNEIKLAESVSDNYYRVFSMPNNLNGLQYNISIIPDVVGNTELLIRYGGHEQIYFLEQFISNDSSIGYGFNNISKNDGIIQIIHLISSSQPSPDTTNPTISITNPLNNTNVSSHIIIVASASDDVALAEVQFLIDGTNIGQVTIAPYAIGWDTSLYTNSQHTITAIAIDNSSNTAATTIFVNINNTILDIIPPTVNITSPQNKSVVNGTITINATASDNIGIAGVTFKYNNTNIGPEDTTAPYNITWNTTNVSNGTYVITALARDTSNNTANYSIFVNVSNNAAMNNTINNTINNSGYSLPLVISSNKRYLADQNSKPFFLVGDAAWSLIAQLNKSDADLYLQNRSSLGFDLIMVNLIEHQFATNAPNNFYNVAPFSGTAFQSTPNEAYFANADYIIQSAAQKGIVVLLAPVYLGYDCGGQGWCSEVKAASLAQMLSWGQYVGNRYKNYTNIIWLIGGDTDPSTPTDVRPKLAQVVAGIQQNNSNPIFTAHNDEEEMAIDPWSGASWLNLNDVYTYSTTQYANAKNAYQLSPTIPFFLLETAYENEHSSTAQQLRAQSYWTVLSGGFGNIFGNCPIWHFNGDASGSFCLNSIKWKTQLGNQGSLNMKYFAQLFNSRYWYNLIPDFNHKVLTVGYGTNGNTDYVTAASASDGSSIIAYLPTSRAVTVNTSSINGTNINVWWYNPSNGSATLNGTYANSGLRTFTPAAGDWVLVIDNAALNLPTPGSYSSMPTPPDIIPPTINIINPINNTNVSSIITIVANASDNVGVAGVTFYYNNTIIGPEDTAAPYSIDWNTTSLPNGPYAITALARDAANNNATSVPIFITVNNAVNNTINNSYNANIMMLGDSITAGAGDTRGGYRSQLYYLLNHSGYNFNFVGRSNIYHDPPLNFTFPSAYWNHEGYNSATIDNSGSVYVWNQNIAGCLATNMPDIILVMLGTNDIWSTIRNSTQVRDEMSSFLDQIWAINPNIKVILSTIPYETANSGNLVIIQQTNALWPALVAQKSAQGRYITLVDNYAATLAANSFADGIHPTTAGNIAMANAWYPAVVAAINGGPATDSTPPSLTVTRSIANPNSSQQITFNASASDASGISRILLYVNNSLVNNCTSSPCIYTAGPWANGTNISYFANASDIFNNTARNPAAGAYSFVVLNPSNQSNQSNQSTPDHIIYQENLVSPWTTDGSYGGTYTVQSSARPYNGTYSISAASSAWGILSLKKGTYWTTDNLSGFNYSALRFAIYINTTPVLLRISLGYANSTSGGTVTDWGYVQQTYPAGSWQIVTLNMSQLNPTNAIFNTIEFYTFQGTASAYYLDEIRFIGR